MAQPVRRVRKSDGITTVQIKWREGGRGSAWQSETFARGSSAQNEARALAFRLDVEAAGNRWPAGWVRQAGYGGPTSGGDGAAPEGGTGTPSQPSPTPSPAAARHDPMTMTELAAHYFGKGRNGLEQRLR